MNDTNPLEPSSDSGHHSAVDVSMAEKAAGEIAAAENSVSENSVSEKVVGETPSGTHTIVKLGRSVRDEVNVRASDIDAEEVEANSPLRSSLQAAFASTLTSLLVVLVLLVAVRLIVPSLVEEIRYAWFRGQLRAQYETSDQALQQVSLDGLNGISKAISQRVGPSVVHINVRDVVDSRWSELLGDKAAPESMLLQGQGSGVIVDTQGHILTNFHVIESSKEIEVWLGDGRRLLAKVVGIDRITDLALLKIDANGLMPIAWGNSDDADVGTLVWAAGSPFGLKSSFTLGILSGKHRTDLKGNRFELVAGDRDRGVYRDLMQSDVAVNPGNSGGPLINSRGELIGINTAIVGDSYRGISFSIPSNVAKTVYESLLVSGLVERGWLGVRLADYVEDDQELKETRTGLGAVVSGIPLDGESPALKAGIEVGDRIVEFNGSQVPDHMTLKRLIGEAGPNANVKMVVIREGARVALEVVLGSRPDDGF
jgi:S1-C subfamily serine protease